MKLPNRALILRADGSVWWTTNLPDHIDGLDMSGPPMIKRIEADGSVLTESLWEEGCYVLDCATIEAEHFSELLTDSATLRVREVEGKIQFMQVVDVGDGETAEIEHPFETRKKVRDGVKEIRTRSRLL